MSRVGYCYCFFFSSRRRHTRLQGDWSSDVCYSDLGRHLGRARDREKARLALDQQVVGLLVAVGAVSAVAADVADDEARKALAQRRVGQAHARGRAGRQVLHQHVGTLQQLDRKSTRLNSSHLVISYAVFCLKKKRTS